MELLGIMKKLLKKILFKRELPRRVPFGLYRGLNLSIDPGCELQLYFGLYERETYPWLKKAVLGARSAIDVGAGYGELTLWLLKQKTIEKVYAFEPDAKRWPKFEANLAGNPRAARQTLHLEKGFFEGDEAVKILQQAPGPVLLKIDIDGGEFDLLTCLKNELHGKDARILLEVHSEELNRQCRALLEEIGYQVAPIQKAWWRWLVPEQRPLGFNQWLVALKK